LTLYSTVDVVAVARRTVRTACIVVGRRGYRRHVPSLRWSKS
jgi:hypothetical protein